MIDGSDAWIAAGSELFRDLSDRLSDLTAEYGSGLASDLLNAEYTRRSSVLHSLQIRCTVRRNLDVSPLLRLPPEIVREVLMIVSSDQHVRSWSKFGHVGSTLRNILHSHETIWANNACIIEHADGRRYILERTGNAPLNLVVKCFPGYSDALSESQRAKYIQSNDNTFITRMLDRLGSTPIEHPRLECLELSMVRRTNTSFWMTRVERIRQPISVPSLRILRLDDLNILSSFPSLAISLN